jgi:hypothetical protein
MAPPGVLGLGKRNACEVPLDDDHTITYQMSVTRGRPGTGSGAGGANTDPVPLKRNGSGWFDRFRPVQDPSNDFLIDRDEQRRSKGPNGYTGIKVIAMQDAAVTSSPLSIPLSPSPRTRCMTNLPDAGATGGRYMTLDELATAALEELLACRRDIHTLLSPRGRFWAVESDPTSPAGWASRTFGIVLTDAPPLTVVDVLPRGPAQRAGLRRGQAMLTINGQPTGHLRRVHATARLDWQHGAVNLLTVRAPGRESMNLKLQSDPPCGRSAPVRLQLRDRSALGRRAVIPATRAS